MATHEYKQIPDFVAFQLLRYTDLNDILGNLRYFSEDILDVSNPDAVDGFAMHLKLGNSTVGGTIYWNDNDDTIKTVHDNADTLEFHNTNIKLLGDLKMTKGNRKAISFHTDNFIGVSAYLGSRSGSKRGGFGLDEVSQNILSVSFIVKTTSFTSSGTITPRIKENGTNLIALSDLSISANDTIYSTYSTYSMGTHVTNGSAGYGIEPYLEFNSGSFAVKAACFIEVVTQ